MPRMTAPLPAEGVEIKLSGPEAEALFGIEQAYARARASILASRGHEGRDADVVRDDHGRPVALKVIPRTLLVPASAAPVPEPEGEDATEGAPSAA